MPKQARIEVTDELYLASADTLLTRLHSLDGTVRCAMLVGHNPGIEDLALFLVGSGDAELRGAARGEAPHWRRGDALLRRRMDPARRQPGPGRRAVHATRPVAVKSPCSRTDHESVSSGQRRGAAVEG